MPNFRSLLSPSRHDSVIVTSDSVLPKLNFQTKTHRVQQVLLRSPSSPLSATLPRSTHVRQTISRLAERKPSHSESGSPAPCALPEEQSAGGLLLTLENVAALRTRETDAQVTLLYNEDAARAARSLRPETCTTASAARRTASMAATECSECTSLRRELDNPEEESVIKRQKRRRQDPKDREERGAPGSRVSVTLLWAPLTLCVVLLLLLAAAFLYTWRTSLLRGEFSLLCLNLTHEDVALCGY